MKNVLVAFGIILIGTSFALGYYEGLPKDKKLLTTAEAKKFSLENAPSNSLRGSIITLQGDVQWQSRIATEPAQIKSQRIIQQGERLITGDSGTVTIQFPHSVLIDVLRNTNLNFIQTLPANIVVSQTSGTATYTKTDKIPLSIRNSDLLTTLHQGVITVISDKNSNITTITVKKGSSIEVFNDSQNNSNIATVSAGSTYVFDNDTKEGTIE